jgi:hypothetical protein
MLDKCREKSIDKGYNDIISFHGPNHYKEAIEAGLELLKIRYYLSHRLVYWPRDEKRIKTFFIKAGLDNIMTKRLSWIDKFEDGGQVFDFFADPGGDVLYNTKPVKKKCLVSY